MATGKKINKFIFINFIVLLLLLVSQGVLLSFYTDKAINSEITVYYSEYLEQLNNNITTKLKGTRNVINILEEYINTSKTIGSLYNEDPNSFEFSNQSQKILNDLLLINNSMYGLEDIILLTKGYSFKIFEVHKMSRSIDDISLYDEKDLEDPVRKPLIITSENEKNKIIDFIGSSCSNDSEKKELLEKLKKQLKHNLLVASYIKSEIDGRKYLALLSFLKNEFINNIRDNALLNNLVILSDSGDVLYSLSNYYNNEMKYAAIKRIGEEKKSTGSFDLYFDKIKFKVIYSINEYSNFKVMYIIPEKVLNKDVSKIDKLIIIIISLFAIIDFVVMYFFFKNIIIVPLANLISAINNSFRGTLKTFNKLSNPNFLMNISLKYKFFIMCFIVFLLPSFFLTYIVYNTAMNIMEHNRYVFYELITSDTIRNIDSKLNDYDFLSKNIIFNKNVQKSLLLSEDKISGKESINITNLILNGHYNLDGVSNIKLYNREGKPIFALIGNDTLGKELFNENYPRFFEKEHYGKIYWQGIRMNTFNYNNISLIREIRESESFSNIIGFLVIEINESVLNNILVNSKRMVFEPILTDENNIIVSCSNKNFIAKTMDAYKEHIINAYRDKDYFLISRTSDICDWNITFLLSRRDIKNQLKVNLLFNLYLFFVFISVIGLATFLIFQKLILPVVYLNSHIKGAVGGTLLSRNRKFDGFGMSYDEINELGQSFNILIDRVNNLIQEVYISKIKGSDLERKKKEAELNALQSNINPHFIFNTLESINWMIMLGRSKEATTMINQFSDLLRFGLNKGNLLISIREEILCIKAYMEIQQVRFKNKINFICDISPEILKYNIIKLTLQPIIENSVYYGTKNKRGLLTIILKGYMDNNRIIIEIIDDGPGINELKLSQIKRNLDSEESESIGIKNVYDRIKLYFGEEYYVNVSSVYGKGTTVVITLPIIEKDVKAHI